MLHIEDVIQHIKSKTLNFEWQISYQEDFLILINGALLIRFKICLF